MLKLPGELLEAICLGKMSYGHGRALAVLEPSEAEEVGKRVLREGLSVRETEALAQSLRGQTSPARPYQVQIHDNQMILTFSNADELERFKKAKKI
jgi:ParB family chromosome partitioning protein